MNTKFARRGADILDVEVTNVSTEGLWLRIGRERFPLPYREFPWFRGAVLAHVRNVTMPHPDSVRWPDLDIDLAIDSIRHPERFPLLYR